MAKVAKKSGISKKTMVSKKASIPKKSNASKNLTISKKPNKSKKVEKPLFFWRETEKEGGFLSPWYPLCSFTGDDGMEYESVGHYIMAEKARLFNDEVTTLSFHGESFQ